MTDSLQQRSGEALASHEVIVERFFRPRGEPPSAHDDGFLPDLDVEYGNLYCPKTVRLADILQSHCLVLLGEPGIGKSTVMERRRQDSGDALVFDLRWDSASTVLNCPELLAWQKGQCELHLIIDSVDEADNPDFARLFCGQLQRGPIARLCLELACRGAEWPKVLEERLQRLFGDGQVRHFQIEPLRRKDAIAIAQSKCIDADSFLAAVRVAGLGALASVPITLRLLLAIFEADKTLPNSQSAIYERACLELCRETSTTKRRDAGTLDATTKLERASELAVISILCRRNQFIDSLTPTEAGAVAIVDLISVIPTLGETSVRESLQTGLFTQRGAGNWGWFHQSFPEFLAARWLSRSSTSEVKLRQLLFHPSDNSALVPQLTGVASWLGAMDPRVANLLSRFAPETFVAIQSDIATDAQREVATEALLSRFASLESTYWLSRDEARRLSHPNLSSQLRPFISVSNTNLAVLRHALSVAANSGHRDLVPEMCVLAQNEALNADVRADAIDAAFLMAPEDTQIPANMRQLLEKGGDAQVHDDVRGAVLSNLWPRWLRSMDLFQFLTFPAQSSYTGKYGNFLWNLKHSLKPEHLPDALAWVARTGRQGDLCDWLSAEKLSAAICRMALQHIEDGQIRTVLAGVVLQLLQKAQPVFGDHHGDKKPRLADLDPSRAKIRILILEISKITSDPSSDAYRTVIPHGEEPLAASEDVPWLLEEWKSNSGNARDYLAHMVNRLIWRTWDQSLLALVLNEIGDERESPLLPMARWVEIDSEEAANQRRVHQWELEHEVFLSRQQEAKVAVKQERATLLASAVAGDLGSWVGFVKRAVDDALTSHEEDRTSAFRLEEETDETLPGLLACAKRYIMTQPDPSVPTVAGARPSLRARVLASYTSLRLLQRNITEPNELAQYVGKCVEAIVAFPIFHLRHDADRLAHYQLMALAFAGNPVGFLASLRSVLGNGKHQNYSIEIWNYLPKADDVCDVIVELATDPGNSQRVGALFEGLLIVDRERALKWSGEQLKPQWPTEQVTPVNSTEGHTQIASILAKEGKSDSWELVWQICLLHPDVALQVFPTLHDELHNEEWGANLTDTQLSYLFEWLEQHAPIYKVDDADFSFESRFRQGLVSRLANRGTAEALQQIQRLRHLFPESIVLRLAHSRATQQMLEKSWSPLSLADFGRFFANGDSRLVSSDEQLLSVVLEALDVYQFEMQSETPAVVDLWSYSIVDNRKVYRPKDENDFSDHLARFLRRQLSGTVVNREVEIRPHDADRPGEHTDLLIQATSAEKREVFQVVIEAKGSWNPNLETDIENQLRNRYLARGNIHCGIYLVGWFACANWDGKDGRQRATQNRDKEAITTALSVRALELSTEGRRIGAKVLDLTLGKSHGN